MNKEKSLEKNEKLLAFCEKSADSFSNKLRRSDGFRSRAQVVGINDKCDSRSLTLHYF